MSPEALIGVGGFVISLAVLCFAIWRGFTLSSLSFLGLKVDLPNPLKAGPSRSFVYPATVLLGLGATAVVWGSYQKWFPEEWPTRLSQVRQAELRLFDVDDFMTVKVNGQPIAAAEYGVPSGWISFKDQLRQGMNAIEFIIQNGTYGGCGGSLELRLNGLRDPQFLWTWFKQEDQLPDIVCFQGTRTLELL